MADPSEVTQIIKASVQLRAKFEEEPELCILPHMQQIEGEDFNIKTMVISQLQPLQIIVTHTGVQHLAGKQLSQATCEYCRESMGISGCVMCQKWMCRGCTL